MKHGKCSLARCWLCSVHVIFALDILCYVVREWETRAAAARVDHDVASLITDTCGSGKIASVCDNVTKAAESSEDEG